MQNDIDNPRVFRLTGEHRTLRTPIPTAHRLSGCTPEWHVISTTFGHHGGAENELSAAGWRVYNPLHLQRRRGQPDKIIPLFGSYLFVCWPRDSEWGDVRRVRFVWAVLMSGFGRPAVVPSGVIEALQARTSARRIVDDPLATPVGYKPGQRLAVVDGPLAGLEGVCKLSAGERVRLLFQLCGQDQELDLPYVDVLAV